LSSSFHEIIKTMLKRIARGKSGGRKKIHSREDKPTQANLYLPAAELEAFCRLVPAAADRNKLVTGWVRAYTIADGESDRLLAQSPLSAKLATYLEATDAPQELQDELESLMVARASDEVRVSESVTVAKGGSYVV
jgi:hypothetical protein